MPRTAPTAALLLLAAGLATAAPPAAAAEAFWSVSAGAYDVGGYTYDTGEVGAEVCFAPRLRRQFPERLELRPMGGAAVTTDGAFWGYGGLRADLAAGRRWVVSPSFGVVLYRAGSGKDLGGPVEFRSALEVARRLAGGSRVGLAFYHISNARLYDHNPGSNSLVLTWGR
jgi:lipid A 3-O-deacylase